MRDVQSAECAGCCDDKERSKVENLGTQEAEG